MRERFDPVEDDPEKIVEVWIDAVRCKERHSWRVLVFARVATGVAARLDAVRGRALVEVQEPFQQLDELLLSWC